MRVLSFKELLKLVWLHKYKIIVAFVIFFAITSSFMTRSLCSVN